MKSIQECTVFDLRITQTNQDRGIPRYMCNLITQLAKDHPESNFHFMLDQNEPLPFYYEKFKNFGQFFFVEEGSKLFNKKRIHNYFVSSFPLPPGSQNFFESLYPSFLYGHAPYILGMNWDLIPLVFSDRYILPQNKGMFMPAYAAMHEADHLFAISRQSAIDAQRLLNISDSKITTIYGGVAQEIVEAIKNTPHEEEKLSFAFGTFFNKKYFVYLGGDEWRKNMPGIIQAYRIVLEMSKGSPVNPLIIVCSMTNDARQQLYELICQNGLNPKRDVIISGHVSDINLVRLLKNAKGLIFPSLYEGLGLPILESYACGTPVISSSESSMREIVHPDCLFNPYHPHEIAAKILEFTQNADLRRVSLEFGSDILKKMTWQNASALIAPNLTMPRKQDRYNFVKKQNSSPLAIFSILPPDNSGIAEHSYATFKHTPWELHFYHHFASNKIDSRIKDHFQVFHPRLFTICSKIYNYEKILFVLGNSPHHIEGLQALLHNGSVASYDKYLYLHDIQLLNLWIAYFKDNIEELKLFLIKFYPEKEKEISNCYSHQEIIANVKIYGIRPLCRLCKIKKILVNSTEAKNLLFHDLNGLEKVDCEQLFLQIIDESISNLDSKPAKSLSCIGHFGCVDQVKHPNILLEACKILNERHPLKLIFAGYDIRYSLSNFKFKFPEFVEIFDSPSHDELLTLMQQVDIGVQLRWPTHGESSGIINQLLHLNKPVIATDLGSFRDYKDCLTLTKEGITPSELAEVIEQTLLNKDQLSHHISEIKQRFSLKAFLERFQQAMHL